jgi:hypothetical protein
LTVNGYLINNSTTNRFYLVGPLGPILDVGLVFWAQIQMFLASFRKKEKKE